jgi:ferric-dicitrate binding protein FerR (iron transport regulator)
MTKTLRRLSVEPLSDHRWAKIERGVFGRLELAADGPISHPVPHGRKPALRAWFLAAALGVLAVVAVAVSALPDRAVIDRPSRITTGASASHLALPGLSLDVEPQSAVVIDTEAPGGQLIVLDRGTIVCQVAPRSRETPLIVQAGGTRVRVIGTRFRVTRLGEAAHVQVREGTVEVTSRGGSWRVQAGEEWPPRLADGSVADRPSPNTEAAARPEALPASAEQARDEAVTQKPLGEKREKPAAERVLPEKELTSPRPRSTPSTSARTKSDETEARVAEPEPTGTKPGPSSQDVFERATALERSDPARASQLYRSLESGADSWAQNALYARGRLAASRGNAGEARRLLEQYLERFPRGSNAEDARAVLRRLR